MLTFVDYKLIRFKVLSKVLKNQRNKFFDTFEEYFTKFLINYKTLFNEYIKMVVQLKKVFK